MAFRRARENVGLSQADVARMLALDPSTVTSWEIGRTLPRANTLARLSGIYCCSIEQLLEGNPTYPPTEK